MFIQFGDCLLKLAKKKHLNQLVSYLFLKGTLLLILNLPTSHLWASSENKIKLLSALYLFVYSKVCCSMQWQGCK